MAKNNDKIRVGVDSNIIIYLAKYANPAFDPNGNIHKLLEMKALCPEAYDGISTENLPPLLQDGFLGSVITLPNGTQLYRNLMDIKNIYDYILSGKLEICVSPTVYFEIERNYINREFVENYATRLQVNNEDAAEFFGKRWDLAERYSKYIPRERDAVTLKERISADACEMAEYSLFGLNVVTANERHLIHKFPHDKDYIIADGIVDVNDQYGLKFVTSGDKIHKPGPYSVDHFVSILKKASKSFYDGRMTFINSNIDENGTYISR